MLSAIPPMLPGAVLAMVGMLIVLIVLFSSGGAAKSRQLSAISEILAGSRGAGARRAFLVGTMMIVFGSCGAFAGVAVGDAQRRELCEQTCIDRGYASGKIQPSSKPVPAPSGTGRRGFVACACTDGPDPDPLELRADDLEPAS